MARKVSTMHALLYLLHFFGGISAAVFANGAAVAWCLGFLVLLEWDEFKRGS
jgi:hypothetical protein